MTKLKCRVSCVLAFLFLVSVAMPSFAVDLRCETVCVNNPPCDEPCTVYGWWTTCGDEFYQCSGFAADSAEKQDSELLQTPVCETHTVLTEPALEEEPEVVPIQR